MAKVLIDIPDKAYRRISEKSEVLYSEMIILNGTPLTDLTNGEVHQKVFTSLNTKIGAKNLEVYLDSDTECVGVYDFDWWNRKWGE